MAYLVAGTGAGGGIDSNLEQTRTIVASLQTAVDFVRVLSESLAVVTQLLASATMTDVQESITLLIYCHKFQVCLWQVLLCLTLCCKILKQETRRQIMYADFQQVRCKVVRWTGMHSV